MLTRYARLCRLEQLSREHSRAMRGWNHPHNIAWAATREISGSRSLRDWCRLLENRVRDLEAANRQQAADLPEAADELRDSEPSEPVVIRRRGEGGQPHAK